MIGERVRCERYLGGFPHPSFPLEGDSSRYASSIRCSTDISSGETTCMEAADGGSSTSCDRPGVEGEKAFHPSIIKVKLCSEESRLKGVLEGERAGVERRPVSRYGSMGGYVS